MPRHDAGAQALIRRAAANDAVESMDGVVAVHAVGAIDAIDAADAVDADAGVARIEWIDETASTNADLLAWVRACDDGAIAPRLLAAHRQTAGRGRRGKAWHGVRGESLTFSLAWPLARADASGLSLAVGVAIADALAPSDVGGLSGNGGDGGDGDGEAHGSSHGGVYGSPCSTSRLGLKWPNDLWLTDAALGNGRKLGGVLIEMVAHRASRRMGPVAVIGVGINIGSQAVPEATGGVAWLREIDAEATPASTLGILAPALQQALRVFERAGFAAFAASFAARDLLCSRAVRCLSGSADELCGTAVGVSPGGELLVRTAAGRLSRIGSGEVSIRLADDAAAAEARAAAPGRAC